MPKKIVKTLTETDYLNAASFLDCEVEAIKAVAKIEAPKGGFNDDGTPVILFEGHWFHKYTDGIYDGDFDHLSYPKWTRKWYGKNQDEEYVRFNDACELNKTAAQLSTSWGKFQIMGFNFAICGFQTISKFVSAMKKSESEHLNAFCHYVKNTGLVESLKICGWETFAYRYNGPEYKKNKYAERLANAYYKFKEKN